MLYAQRKIDWLFWVWVVILFQLVAVPSLSSQVRPTGWLTYGTNFTEVHVAGHSGFVLFPTKPAPDGSKPWVWYAPSLKGRFPDQGNGWLFTRLLAHGFTVCGVDVGESYGSPDGVKVYSQFYNLVVHRYGLSPKVCLLPQSRGGLMLYNWAAGHADSVQCIGGIYPVGDLRSYPGLARACAAYHMTEQELRRRLPEFNPIDRLDALATRRVPILHLHGNSDKVVPLEANSLAIARRYKALGGKMQIVIVNGKGHEEIPPFFQSRDLLNFFLSLGKKFPSARH